MGDAVKFYSPRVDIESMKKLALIMMFGISGVVLSAEEFTIQTISAQKEASITPAFEKKVHKSTLLSEKKKEGSCNIVTVGKYPSAAAARHDLKKAKTISKDAFVRPINRTVPKSCDTHVAAAETKKSVVEAKNEKASEAHAPVVVATVSKEAIAHEPVKASDVHTPTVQHTTVASAVAEVKPEVKSEPCKVQPCENVTNNVYVYDKNLARKSDIHEAIEYYKRSPYHTFKPVLTQR